MSETVRPSTSGEWQLARDPARPDWPGVLIVGPEPEAVVIPVVAGTPRNFSDSHLLATMIAAFLAAHPWAVPSGRTATDGETA